MSGDLTNSGPESVLGGRTPRGICDSLGFGMRFATAAAAALLTGAASPALAAGGFSPFATLGYDYDSNVFMRPSDAPPVAGITAPSDSVLTFAAGLGDEIDWGPQQLTLNAGATRDQYDRFSFLDHYEYHFGGNLDWQLGPVVDGTASYLQSRYMAQFANTFSTALLLDTERTGNVTVKILMTPEWRLGLTPELHELDTPLAGFPGFKVVETIGIAGLDYLGFGKLTAGMQFTADDGRYEGITAATRYQQHETDLTANYKVSGLSTFSASAGYTNRNSEADPADSTPAAGGAFADYAGTLGETSSVTGSLTYRRQLTGKTNLNLSLFRRVDSYTAGANPEIGTGGSAGVTWRADAKITLNLNYSLTRDQVKGGLIVVNVTNMDDRTQTMEFEVRYAALSWLTIRPYVDWAKATSTFTLENYSATTVGIEVTTRPQQ